MVSFTSEPYSTYLPPILKLKSLCLLPRWRQRAERRRLEERAVGLRPPLFPGIGFPGPAPPGFRMPSNIVGGDYDRHPFIGQGGLGPFPPGRPLGGRSGGGIMPQLNNGGFVGGQPGLGTRLPGQLRGDAAGGPFYM